MVISMSNILTDFLHGDIKTCRMVGSVMFRERIFYVKSINRA